MTDIVLSRYAKRVLKHAAHIAHSLQHPAIEPVHILLALTQETDGMASQILDEATIDSDSLFEFLQLHEQTRSDEPHENDKTLSQASAEALTRAADNARLPGLHTISTIHLLQAILQKPDPTVRAFLAYRGLSSRTIYDDTLLILTHRADDDAERKSLYSDEVMDVLALASTEASRAKRIYIEPEHLLLALLELPWQGAHTVFQYQHIRLEQIVNAVDHLHGKRKQNKTGSPPLPAHNTKLVLQAAEAIAAQIQRPVRAYDIFYVLMQPRFPLQLLWQSLGIDLYQLERDLRKYGVIWQKPPSLLQQFRDFPHEVWFWFGFPIRVVQHLFRQYTKDTE